MSYSVVFQEVNANGGGFAPFGKPEHMGSFKTEALARHFVQGNVNFQDREWLGEAEIAGQKEELALFQGDALLGYYRIAA